MITVFHTEANLPENQGINDTYFRAMEEHIANDLKRQLADTVSREKGDQIVRVSKVHNPVKNCEVMMAKLIVIPHDDYVYAKRALQRMVAQHKITPANITKLLEIFNL